MKLIFLYPNIKIPLRPQKEISCIELSNSKRAFLNEALEPCKLSGLS